MKNITAKLLPPFLAFLAAGCVNTYYDPSDPYTLGLRFYDRGNIQNAERAWKPLLEKNDPDAQFRYGWMLWNNQLGPNRESEAIELFRKAAAQGQTKALILLGDLYYQSPKNPMWIVKNPPFEKDTSVGLQYYLKAEKTAYYKGEKALVAQLLPRVKSEVSPETYQAAEQAAATWTPEIVGRKPRQLK